MRSKRDINLVFLSTVIVLSLFCFLYTDCSWAVEKDDILVQMSLQKVKPLTSELLRLANDFRTAVPQAKAEVSNQLTLVAQRRKQALLNLISKHPEVVLDVALPSGVRSLFLQTFKSILRKKLLLRER